MLRHLLTTKKCSLLSASTPKRILGYTCSTPQQQQIILRKFHSNSLTRQSEGSPAANPTSPASSTPVQQATTQEPAKPAAQQKAPRKRVINKQVFSLTDTAAQKVKELLSRQEKAVGLKVGVRRRGCSGYSYTIEYAMEAPKVAEVVQDKGVTIYIDPKSLLSVIGTEMDYVETDVKEGFEWRNPNAKGTCGCGESFHV